MPHGETLLLGVALSERKSCKNSLMQKFAIILFLIGQAFSVAHAGEFGSHPHDHNGIHCYAILNDEQEGFGATTHSAEPAFLACVVAVPESARQAPAKPANSVLPPSTGPPSIQPA